MKRLVQCFIIILITNSAIAQNGIYKSDYQRFEDENNPSRNAVHNNTMLVTIQINEITGGFVLVSSQEGGDALKWDILKKIDTRVKAEDKVVFTYYDSRWNLSNIQTESVWVIVVVQDMKNNSLHIAATNLKAGTTNWFQNLTKITY